jgi:Rrf2 family protein
MGFSHWVSHNFKKSNFGGKMRITLESDYALRIVSELAKRTEIVDAKTISALTSVTEKFTLKILRKLVKGGYVKSFKGANGGYGLNACAKDITLKEIIELIDGPIILTKCLDSDGCCSLNKDKTACVYHHIFDEISLDVAKKLAKITIFDVISKRTGDA